MSFKFACIIGVRCALFCFAASVSGRPKSSRKNFVSVGPELLWSDAFSYMPFLAFFFLGHCKKCVCLFQYSPGSFWLLCQNESFIARPAGVHKNDNIEFNPLHIASYGVLNAGGSTML